MARRYYRRRTVTVRPKRKWATNMVQGEITEATPGVILATNSSQTANPTPIIVKVGNFKLQGDMHVQPGAGSTALVVRVTIVVYYLPEGVALSASSATAALENHPEWVMAWKQLDTTLSGGAGTQSNSFSVSSRLKRNLNSGDKVCIGYVTDTDGARPDIKFTCQYWTCAN